MAKGENGQTKCKKSTDTHTHIHTHKLRANKNKGERAWETYAKKT